ncbi:acyltransferase [Atopomonas sediminilitoris]|uniref:acyltransferase n=1 Tax=Atopomonas sediminilitoris TaxID=2919919 RepID=UPI001F4F0F90|nr:acyltransferase [Atopomonas sediminilitoris]MCJ8169791.1 acyltransferase [Atopomonas sediminilitoris]
MLSVLPAPVRGVITALLLAVNTIFCFVPLLSLSLFKLLLPLVFVQKHCRTIMTWIANSWIRINNAWMNAVGPTEFDTQGLQTLDLQHSYLITSNHQSWVDILVLQNQCLGRIPFLKFFLKQELIWVPVIGLCWWALEFPFMKRYSKAYLAKHPEKAGTDLDTTRKACDKFRTNPVAVFNFLEGTRLTEAKHARQQSPFKHLLKPKAGGVAFVLDAMGDQLQGMVNATIYYPDGVPTFWDLLCGRVRKVVVRAELTPIPAEFIGQRYDRDEAYRLRFQQWVNGLWEAKDAQLEQLKAHP